MNERRKGLRAVRDRVRSLADVLPNRGTRRAPTPDSSERTPEASQESQVSSPRVQSDTPNDEPTADSPQSSESIRTETNDPFDREIEQYYSAAQDLDDQAKNLLAKMDECRDGGDLLADFQRYEQQLRRVRKWQRELTAGREKYIVDRDNLASWGPTDDWVVAGSIVTVRYLDGHRDTFVLTERHTDTEYETVSYDSPLGQAVRRRRVGDKVSLPAGAPVVVESIKPGFRKSPPPGEPKPSRNAPPGPVRRARQIPTAANAADALAHQRCTDETYRRDLYRRRYEAHVRKINKHVDELRSTHRAEIPYVAPSYGGVDARLLTLMQDPGPKTNLANVDGSGMICVENADLTAARQKFFLNEAGINVLDIVSWNAYPWPKPHPQTPESDRQAALALRDFLSFTPHIEVVILNGTVARRIWRLLENVSAPRAFEDITPISTFHTSERAINPNQKSPDYIDSVHRDLSSKYATAARLLYGSSSY